MRAKDGNRPSRPARAFSFLVVLMSGVSALQAQVVASNDEFPVNQETLDDQFTTTVAAGADRSFVVVWESFGQDTVSSWGIFSRALAPDGTPLADEQPVNTTATNDQLDADVTRLTDGRFFVVWDSDLQDGELRGIFGRFLDAAGQPTGAEIPINATTAGDQNDPVVAPLPGGGFVAVWETAPDGNPFEDLAMRIFDAAGTPLSGELAVHVYTTGDQEDADVGTSDDGTIVVVWESEVQDGHLDGVVVRRFDATGQPLADEAVVNTFITGDQDDPALAVAADGRFVVVWEDDTQDSAVDALYARIYDAGGNPTTPEIHVDADAGRQMNPRVALDRLGQALIVWDSLGQDAEGVGIVANLFDTAGVALGTEQIVNTDESDDQYLPHAAVGPFGDVMVVWESDGAHDGSLFGVFGRRYALGIFSDGFESGDTLGWSASSP